MYSIHRYLTLSDFVLDGSKEIHVGDEGEARARLAKHELILALKGDPKRILNVAERVVPGTPPLLAVAYWEGRFVLRRPSGLRGWVLSLSTSLILSCMNKVVYWRLEPADRWITSELGLQVGVCAINWFMRTSLIKG